MGLKTQLLAFMVTITWLASWWTGTDWRPLASGYAIYKAVDYTGWRMCSLNQWGACRTSAPVGSIVLWAVMPPDDDTCPVYDPPTAQGPANMGIEYDVRTPVTRFVRFSGECKP